MITKWIAVNVVNEWDRRYRDLYSDPRFGTFWQQLSKSESASPDQFQAARALLGILFRSDVFWRRLDDENLEVLGRNPSFRAPAAHGVSS